MRMVGPKLTINELHTILGELIEDGYGYRNFELLYDNECAKTSIPKKSRIFITNDSIRFSDHQENWLPESRLISGILRDLDEE